MSIGEKLQTIAENEQKVYDAGFVNGRDEGYNLGFEGGTVAGQKAEYDNFWDAYQENGNRRRYRSAFCGESWAKFNSNGEPLLKPKYPIVFEVGRSIQSGMLKDFNVYSGELYDLGDFCSKIDFSNLTYADEMFKNAVAKNITCDFSSLLYMSETFAGGNGGILENINIKVSEKCTKYFLPFLYQERLVNLHFTDDSIIAADINFDQCQGLSKSSIESIIHALSTTVTGSTVTFNKTAVNAALTTDEWNALVASKPNWTITLA